MRTEPVDRVYGNLGGMTVEARRVNSFGPRNIPLGALVGAVAGLIFGTITLYGPSRSPLTLEGFLAIASWYVLAGIVGFSSISATFALYNPYPRAFNGVATLDRVEGGRLWFYAKNGSRASMSLSKRVANVHGEQIIHFGSIPRFLELKTQTSGEMGTLVAALCGQVRILRTYQNEPPEETDDTKKDGTN